MLPWENPWLLALGAWEFVDNVRVNVAERLRLTRKPLVTADLSGKVCVVTGANAGVGKATVEALASRGAHVIMAVRSLDKGTAAAQELRQRSAASGSLLSIEVQHLDLCNLDSVHRFAHGLAVSNGRLDVLICNAGVMAPPTRRQTVDGLEEQFQANYLGHWLLANEVLAGQAARRAAVPAQPGSAVGREGPGDHTRVVMLSSMTHEGGRVNFDDLQCARRYRPFQAYADSKLMNVLATKELQRRLDRNSQPGTAVAVHPGLVDTTLARTFFISCLPRPLQPLLSPLLACCVFPVALRTPEAAAHTVMYAVSAPRDEVAGQYIADGAIKRSSKLSYNPDLAQQLWEISCQLAHCKTPSCLS